MYNIGTENGETKLFRNWIIQKGDNVVIDGWCSCCTPEEEECSPRFFVIDDPQSPRIQRGNAIIIFDAPVMLRVIQITQSVKST